MEPLNLNTLASSLQAGSSSSVTLQNAEQELLNNFKAAALSITTLYRSARNTSERAYNAGYAAACQDLLMMIQQGVSTQSEQDLCPPHHQHHQHHECEHGGMNIGRVMDWIEARLEAIKSREEEEDEDEEKEREREKEKSTKRKATTVSQTPSNTRQPPAATTTATAPSSQQPQSKATPPPPPPSSISTLNRETQPQFTFSPPTPPQPISISNTDAQPSITAGAKRRHAVMMMLDNASNNAGAHGEPSLMEGGLNVNVSANPRRRTRSSTRMVFPQPNLGLSGDERGTSLDMDVEEEGRERKRFARR